MLNYIWSHIWFDQSEHRIPLGSASTDKSVHIVEMNQSNPSTYACNIIKESAVVIVLVMKVSHITLRVMQWIKPNILEMIISPEILA